MPFPLLKMASITYHHQPHRLLRSGRILAKHAKAIGRQTVDWNLVVLKSFKTLLSATSNSTAILDLPVSAMRVILFERGCPEQRPRGAGGAALVAPKQARGRPKRHGFGGWKKNAPPPPPLALLPPQMTPETAKSPRERVPRI
jgi:hypothetical protein